MTVEQGRFPVEQLTPQDIEEFFSGNDGDGLEALHLPGNKEPIATEDVAADAILKEHADTLSVPVVKELVGWDGAKAESWLENQVSEGFYSKQTVEDVVTYVRSG